jgi:hypothetical protein
MKMIAHQAVSMNGPLGFQAALAQGDQELLAIHVVLENVLALVPAIHHVIHRAGVLNP